MTVVDQPNQRVDTATTKTPSSHDGLRRRRDARTWEPGDRAQVQGRFTGRWLATGMAALAAGLIANSLLGPLVGDIVDYPFGETMKNQTIGLEAFSLAVVAPLCLVAGALLARGHRAGPVLAFGPAAYTWYLLLQYVIGPEYEYYPGALPLHLGLFVLSGMLAVGAWATIAERPLPTVSARMQRRRGIVLLLLAGFLVFRYFPMLVDAIHGRPLSAEARGDVSMFWSILLLDLGVVLPATMATAVGLLRRRPWAGKAAYATIGWWLLVPPSVAAMSVAMVVNNDAYAAFGQTVGFVVAAMVFGAVGIRLYRPLFDGESTGGV